MSEEISGDRVRRTFRFDPEAWFCACRISDVHYEGKRHPATDAAFLEAILKPVPFPQKPTKQFADHLARLAEAVAQRLSAPNKKFYYGEDVGEAVIEAAASYPTVRRQSGDPLPFARRLRFVGDPEPSAPWTLTLPLHFEDRMPSGDLRTFMTAALVAKAKSCGLDGMPPKILATPNRLPPIEVARTTRYVDEALVAILAALPLASSLSAEIPLVLRWLSSELTRRKGPAR